MNMCSHYYETVYKSGKIDRETTELLALDLVQKGYRIKEEILIEFFGRLKWSRK